MSKRKRKSKSDGNSQFYEGFVLGDYTPIIIEKGKKFAAYDKNGKLLILGYNRKIVERYANDRVRQG